MKILTYSYEDGTKNGWVFDKVNLQRINLLVGASASGKTRLMNTIFNIALYAVSGVEKSSGKWDVAVEQDGALYHWTIEIGSQSGTENGVVRELITRTKGDEHITIVDRHPDKFLLAGQEMPRLSRTLSAINILREEPLLEPLFRGFSKIRRRSLDSNVANIYQVIPSSLVTRLEKSKDIDLVFVSELGLSVHLYLLHRFFPEVFSKIVQQFRLVFPFVETAEVLDIRKIEENYKSTDSSGNLPAFAIQESHVRKWIAVHDFSSGMKRVLAIITEVLSLPAGAIYMLDEYETSLGINAIGFLPDLLDASENENQFIISSHHPYLINNIPVRYWQIFHREGSIVRIKPGTEIEERVGRSKQQAFTQLINDPFYTEGAE
jgi:hypothetical protein